VVWELWRAQSRQSDSIGALRSCVCQNAEGVGVSGALGGQALASSIISRNWVSGALLVGGFEFGDEEVGGGGVLDLWGTGIHEFARDGVGLAVFLEFEAEVGGVSGVFLVLA
jgi:hypothetical protein